MPFDKTILSYLTELRMRLIRSLVVTAVFFLLLYPFSSRLYYQLALPMLNALPQHQTLIATSPTGAFFAPIKLCLILSFFISAPYILYQIWGFIYPGLYAHEKKIAQLLLTSSIALFYTGISFAYWIIFPFIMTFLTHIAPSGVAVSPDVSSYLSFSLHLLAAFGIAFEMPIIIILLIRSNLVSVDTLNSKRRYIIVGNFILGMLLTPDVLSQILLALPLCLLFEIGLFAAQRIPARITLPS